ncbi:MAG TPA: putative porin [Pseudomonadales bacterium]|nr:putative porin [Pseudomonadales bacterium]
MQKTILSVCGGFMLAAAAIPAASAESVDAKLLAMLKANGSITEAQFTELSADLAKEQRAESREAVSKEDVTAIEQKLGWAERTVISGDIRVRQERVQVEDRSPEQTASRQRYRARLAAVSQVTPTVEAGIRLASGNNNDVRSTNQDMNNYFTKKDIWLDRAYINWHPENVPGLKMIGGRMAQPWTKVAETEMIWDNDVNPEGVAAQYSRKFGDTNVFGSGGAFTVKDNATGFGPEFNNDLRLYYAQLGANLFPGEDFKLTVGASVFHYFKDDQGVPTQAPNAGIGLTLNGNNSTQFQLYEGFGQLDVLGLPLPLSLYGQYVQNPNANGPDDGEDRGYLLGLITRFWEIGVNYSYRDVERNAVVGAFTDSDFASGFTASKGSKLQLTYNITKNFQFLTTYFYTESDASNPAKPGAQTNTLQLDLVATF